MLTKKPLIVGIGEILWDMLPDGRYFGGAPANFIFHTSQLGARTALISRVGSDQLGGEALEECLKMGLDTSNVQIDQNNPTGVMKVELDEKGVPQFRLIEQVAWDFIEFEHKMASLAHHADIVYFGTLAQRNKKSRNTIYELLGCTSQRTIKFFDVNLRQDFYNKQIIRQSLDFADILKLNAEELDIVLELAKPSNFKGRFSAVDILKNYKIELICITLGENGCELKTEYETVIDRAKEVIVKDTVGAGDAFSAALAVNYLAGHDLAKIANAANIMGGFVASHKGACPVINERIYQQTGLYL